MRTRSDSAGFVLVGVVMMVLALTILGLSLFSLSSYEAQFMNQSLDSQQALQCALGGLDRARFALATFPDTLGMVKLGLPRDSVVWARATQIRPGFAGPDTTGPVSAGGNPVLIEVEASYRGMHRRLSASYQPSAVTDYYKRLFTVQDWMKVNDHTGDPLHLPIIQRCGTVVLNGRIWEFNNGGPSDSTTWQGCAGYSTPGVLTSSLPIPDVTNFIAAHSSGAAPPSRTLLGGSPGLINYNLSGTSGQIGYWYLDGPDPDFSVYEQTIVPVSITVSGLAVWMVPRGIRFNSAAPVNVVSTDPKACLVIVAGPGTDPFTSNPSLDPGIWFFGGGLTSSIPVILVSNGQVFIEQVFNFADATSVAKLSVFSRYLFLNGPNQVAVLNPKMTLGHDSRMDATIDTLMVHRALPNSTRVSGVPYTLVPGTWRSSP